jgi:hypothetical protein
MKAVRILITLDLLLATLGVPRGDIELVDAYVDHGTSGVLNLVVSGEQFPEVIDGQPYPTASIEATRPKIVVR